MAEEIIFTPISNSVNKTVQPVLIRGWWEHSDYTIEATVNAFGGETIYRIYGKSKETGERKIEVISYDKEQIEQVRELLSKL